MPSTRPQVILPHRWQPHCRAGISADERAIEVDHIVPRKHGGEDDLTNLQALCFKCNANKGARESVKRYHALVWNFTKDTS
jgi:5-methylcytosine-specific restriction endonuclease McrA